MRCLMIVVAVLSMATQAEAGWIRKRARYIRPNPTVIVASPTIRDFRMTAPASLTADQAQFLAALNAWRASRGCGALAWDATLASWAAANCGVHNQASGCWQVSSPLRSLVQSLSLWQNSPIHAGYLLGRHSVVGGSVCASGATVNLR